MPILDKARVNVGLHSNCKLDLSHQHITSSNFMDLQPVMYRHMMPKEKIVVNADCFARLAPMAVPTYGRCRLNMRAFFVPFRTVMPHFNDFVVDTVSQQYYQVGTPHSGIVTSTPLIPNQSFVYLFTNATYNTSTEVQSIDPYDFAIGTKYYKLSALGRKYWKLIRSLGYNMIPNENDPTVYSALAFLAYLRVYVDWYSLSAYMDTSSYQLFLSWFRYDSPSTPLSLDGKALETALRYLYRVCYDGDYFTAAWDNPVAPNSSLFSQFVIPDITNNGTYSSGGTTYLAQQVVSNSPNGVQSPTQLSVRPSNGTPFVGSNVPSSGGNSFGVLTQYVDDALHALTDYMKRHQLVGARTIDRYLADYGINLPADKLMRSTYLGMSSMDIQIGDVMSHADTASVNNPSNLGDYAGRGQIKGGKTFEFQTSEFGLFVICASILPTAGYVQGYDRNNLHITKDQFFNGDFDNLGVQAVAKGELYISANQSFASYSGSVSDYDGVFGYVPRYAEYKIARDKLTGDMSIPTIMAGGSSWHLMRLFDDASFNSSIAGMLHDIGFCRGDDADQYNRIFNNTASSVDKFYLIYNFSVIAHAPCQSLFDTYQFENPSKQVTLDANGVKMN